MLHGVLMPDVDDEGNRRLHVHDVREVLIRGDAEVGTAGPDGAHELGDDPLKRGLVRHEVLGAKHAPWLGELVHQLPEGGISEPIGKRLRPYTRRAQQGGDRERPSGTTKPENTHRTLRSHSPGVAVFPTKNSPTSAYSALTSSKRMSVTSFLNMRGSPANSVTPHSHTSNPMAPVMTCTTLPAYPRPVAPCALMRRLPSSTTRPYHFCPSLRTFTTGS